MKWISRLLLLFIVLPVVELMLLLQFHGWVDNIWITMGLLLGTGILGTLLVKREGAQAWRRLKERFGAFGIPQDELLDGGIILVSGALLVTPGILTDVIGFSGLLPPTRALIRRGLKAWIRRAQKKGTFAVYGIGLDDSAPPDTMETAWQGEPAERPGYTSAAPPSARREPPLS
jgi:UPF0716 protein FxsA